MSELFDLAYLREMTDGDASLEQELLRRFEQTIRKCLQQLSSSEEAGQWKATLHELRGASMAMGASNLSKFCASGENAPPLSADERQTYLTALSDKTMLTLAEITKLLGA